MKIDKKSYKLSEDNYHNEVYPKSKIVIGNTNTSDMVHWYGWTKRWDGKYTKTTAFTIDKDGTTYQHYNPKYYSDFLGDDIDKTSIGVNLVNEGWLRKDSLNGTYITWLGKKYNGEVINKKWRDMVYWAPYTKEQIKSLRSLILFLSKQYDISDNYIGTNVLIDDVDLYDGVIFRSNYKAERRDVTPAFPFDELKTKKDE